MPWRNQETSCGSPEDVVITAHHLVRLVITSNEARDFEDESTFPHYPPDLDDDEVFDAVVQEYRLQRHDYESGSDRPRGPHSEHFNWMLRQSWCEEGVPQASEDHTIISSKIAELLRQHDIPLQTSTQHGPAPLTPDRISQDSDPQKTSALSQTGKLSAEAYAEDSDAALNFEETSQAIQDEDEQSVSDYSPSLIEDYSSNDDIPCGDHQPFHEPSPDAASYYLSVHHS